MIWDLGGPTAEKKLCAMCLGADGCDYRLMKAFLEMEVGGILQNICSYKIITHKILKIWVVCI